MIYEIQQLRTLRITAQNKTKAMKVVNELSASGEVNDCVEVIKSTLRSCIAIHKTKILK